MNADGIRCGAPGCERLAQSDIGPYCWTHLATPPPPPKETATGWITGLVRCRVCWNIHVAVAPWPEPGLENLECLHCGMLACDEVSA